MLNQASGGYAGPREVRKYFVEIVVWVAHKRAELSLLFISEPWECKRSTSIPHELRAHEQLAPTDPTPTNGRFDHAHRPHVQLRCEAKGEG